MYKTLDRVGNFLFNVADRSSLFGATAAFLLGIIEADGDGGITWGHPETVRSRAYDRGRSLRRRD